MTVPNAARTPIGLLPSWIVAWTRNSRGIFHRNISKTRSSIDKKLCKEAAVNRAPAVIPPIFAESSINCSAAQSTIYSPFRELVCKISSWLYFGRKRVSISLALSLGGGRLSFWLNSLVWSSIQFTSLLQQWEISRWTTTSVIRQAHLLRHETNAKQLLHW